VYRGSYCDEAKRSGVREGRWISCVAVSKAVVWGTRLAGRHIEENWKRIEEICCSGLICKEARWLERQL